MYVYIYDGIQQLIVKKGKERIFFFYLNSFFIVADVFLLR